jgi:predicted RNA-binding Zn-ribbon protein involved in translation (DUF1610 family)
MTKKLHKRLKKPCPECGATLVDVEIQTIRNGVTYIVNRIECVDEECGYYEILRDKGMKKLMFDE